MPKLHKIVLTFKFHPLHAKISTPTGTAIPFEKIKGISSFRPLSNENLFEKLAAWMWSVLPFFIKKFVVVDIRSKHLSISYLFSQVDGRPTGLFLMKISLKSLQPGCGQCCLFYRKSLLLLI